MIDYTQLEALLAVKRGGSFEKAGRALGVSPIAVSRRVEKLGVALGASLLSRKPTRPTEAGEVLCRYAEQIEAAENELLEAQRIACLQSAENGATLKIAINSDSLLGWFHHALKDRLLTEDQPVFDITVIDQDHSIDLMKSGEVIAALSGANQPLSGFRVYHLGSVTHRAVANADFIKFHLEDCATLQTASIAPSLRYDSQDGLTLQWLEMVWGTAAQTCSMRLPCRNSIIENCLAGTAWGIIPEHEIRQHLVDGTLLELIPDTALHKDLYWHVSSAMTEQMADITASVRKASSSSF